MTRRIENPLVATVARPWLALRTTLAASVATLVMVVLLTTGRLAAEPLGEYWGSAEREAEFYKIVELPIPEGLTLEIGSFDLLPDGRLAIGTRRGDIWLVSGAFEEHPQPRYHRYASGLDEIFGLSYRDGSFTLTQQAEVTRDQL